MKILWSINRISLSKFFWTSTSLLWPLGLFLSQFKISVLLIKVLQVFKKIGNLNKDLIMKTINVRKIFNDLLIWQSKTCHCFWLLFGCSSLSYFWKPLAVFMATPHATTSFTFSFYVIFRHFCLCIKFNVKIRKPWIDQSYGVRFFCLLHF